MKIAVFLSLSLLALGACDESSSKARRLDKTSSPSARSGLSASPHVAPPSSLMATPSAQSSKEAEEPSESDGKSGKTTGGLLLGKRRVVLDELVDVAPAGPSAATASGVLLVLRDGSTVLSPLGSGHPKSTRPERTPLDQLQLAPSELVALEHGPAVSEGFAYFVQRGRLVRRRVPSGELEVLADDARAYTRVAALPDSPNKTPSMVGYIARHPTDKSTLVAKLWVEGKGTHTLTPEGSTGNSVALARTSEGCVAVSLESRTGMSPLHARKVSFDGKQLTLGPDVVPWVAGTAQPLTEIHAVGSEQALWALLPIERDATEFGLARVDVGPWPRFGAPVHWRRYPNGLEPAVIATGRLCREPVVLYARPETEAPHSTQQLHLSSIGDDGLGPSTVVASSRSFADASFAELDGGALVVYVADRRTWARRLRCVP